MGEQQHHHFSILGAAGAMGSLFARSLKQAGHHASGFDIRPPASPGDFEAFVVGDVLRPSANVQGAWRESHVLLICLPHEPALEAIKSVVPIASKSTLIVDTLSVKSPVAELLQSLPMECEYLSINPMFAPSLGFKGQKVVAIPCRPGDRSAAFVRMVQSWGATVETRTAEQHDRACAVMQTATHALLICLGQVVRESGLDIAELMKIAPPPHLICLALLSRILSAAPETYWDIQRDNPYGADVRQQLTAALSQLDAVTAAGDAESFAAELESMRHSFEPHLQTLTTMAAEAIRGGLAVRQKG